MHPAKSSLAIGTALFGAGAANATWLTHGNAVVGIICGLGSLIGLWWFIKVQREQVRFLHAQAIHEEMRICAECAKGNPPERCPIPASGAERPCVIRTALNKVLTSQAAADPGAKDPEKP